MTGILQAETVGPVDVAVIAFEGNQFNGDVAPALVELADAGIVRIIDISFLVKDADGNLLIMEGTDAAVADAFERVTGTQFDLLSDEDLAELGEGLDNDSSALIIVWENTWASRFATAARASGGKMAYFERVPHEIVARAIEALDED